MQRIFLLALIFSGFAISQPVYYKYSSPGLVFPENSFPPESYEIVTANGFLPAEGFDYNLPPDAKLAYCNGGNGLQCIVALELLADPPETLLSVVIPSPIPAPYDAYFEEFSPASLTQLGTYIGAQGGTLTISYNAPIPEPASYGFLGLGLLLIFVGRFRHAGCRKPY